ncbi:MAG TPA: phosphatidylglycerol lysyltransferase domain-containing protein, partial [Tepidiformaceae bacterium]|nr:phosphatidylglycerol lysyltransferase domain-containing protein [Tepidiformaceae bacterium]
RQEREKVEQILRLHATTALAYFHLLDDKSYFFSSDERAFISYRVIGHTAVALGEPIGEPLSRRKVVEEFAQHCDLNAWAFCFHQVSAEGAEELRDLGLSALKIGEEAVVPLEQFSLSGKSFKHIRNTVNRLEREGYVFQRLPAPIPPATMDDLAALSDAWLQSGGHRERAFTLGAFSASYLQATPVFVVRRPGERIEAFVNVIPSYGSGQGNFDLMRRRPDAPDGVMDLLFVRLMEHFQREGYSGMNLGFAPLANVEGPGLVARALRILYSRGNGAFKFEGLHSFKDKWQPNWEPKYLVYRSDLQLPQLALAVARAGERTGRLPALGLPNFGRVLHVPVLQPQRGGDA